MEFQIEQEWVAFTRTYKELRQRYEGACQRINFFQQTSESVALLEQRKDIEAQLNKIAEAIQACDEVHDDMTRFSKLHDVITKYNENTQRLEGQLLFAEMNGLTPESPTPQAKKLRTKSKKDFKEGKRLKNEIERINRLFLNNYYNNHINKAEEVVKPFYKQFSWFLRLIINFLFCFRLNLELKEIEYLSWQNIKFLVRVRKIKLWLSKWATKLKSDLKNVRDQWRQAKDLLERQREEDLAALKRHKDEEVLWAHRDPERLAKYLGSDRADRSRVPDCLVISISDTPQDKESGPPIRKKVRVRSKRKKRLASKFVKQDSGGPRWKLFVCDDRFKREIELPDPADESFTTFLANAFNMIGCHANPNDVAKSLRKIVSYTPESLRRHKRVSYSDPKGWRIFRCGRFRILMDISEVPQEKLVKGIFIVRYRADAYPQ